MVGKIFSFAFLTNRNSVRFFSKAYCLLSTGDVMSSSIKSRVNQRLSGKKSNQGFTLIELIVVVAVIVILIVLAFPFFKQLLDESKTPSAAADMQKIIAKIASNHAGGGSDYASSGTAEIASTASGLSTIYTATGSGATAVLTHNFGLSGSTVTFAPATITNTNDAGLITVNTASKGTCPAFVATLQKAAAVIAINSTTVKTATGTYDAAAAGAACTAGDTNTYEITIR
jgi:prepilin-type N-terminal cleavage/methylation domain-containing protein